MEHSDGRLVGISLRRSCRGPAQPGGNYPRSPLDLPQACGLISLEPCSGREHYLSMFTDKETLIVETCLMVAVPVSVGLAALAAVLFH